MSKIGHAFNKSGKNISHAADKAVHMIEKVATSDVAKEIVDGAGKVAVSVVTNPTVQEAAISVAIAAI